MYSQYIQLRSIPTTQCTNDTAMDIPGPSKDNKVSRFITVCILWRQEKNFTCKQRKVNFFRWPHTVWGESSMPLTQEVMTDTTILSFRHSCQSSGNILCFQLPLYCPMCGRSLTNEPLATPPVRYPPILKSSSNYPFSIIIKPTNGTFLGEYENKAELISSILLQHCTSALKHAMAGQFRVVLALESDKDDELTVNTVSTLNYKYGDNLHTGVTDSRGFLCHFNEQGVTYDRSVWHQSLVIPLIEISDFELVTIWDEKLSQITHRPEWTSERYVELGHNCFDFVVAFLNFIQYNYRKQNLNSSITRQSLVDEYILATTSKAAKYINFMKQIQTRGYLLQLDG
ncbi:putative MKRN2 opposite strand protein [Apostichopus japonicus]|uniref:Putative MKRN2 opposite strand protein n=1 Tax=Stichopus japonicus TaxID=307972 RepID=A0A2G8JMV2_STIJA|nr:putative MKRN2 opposite strand protein [Apostichopus japonicus]